MVVAAPLVLGLILTALVCALLIATSKGYQYTFGVTLAWLANQFRNVVTPGWLGGIHILGFIADGIDAGNNWILAKLGEGINATAHAVSYLWARLAHIATATGEAIAYLAQESEKGFGVLVKSTIPLALSAVFGPLAGVVYGHSKQLAHLLRDTTAREAAREIAKLRARVAAIALPRPALGPTLADWDAVKRKLKSLERFGTIAGIAGLIYAGLNAIGLSHLTRSQCKTNTGKLCASNPTWIENLFAGALALFITYDLVEFAKVCEDLTKPVAGQIAYFWRVNAPATDANPGLGETG